MVQNQKINRIFASLTALLLVFMLVGSMLLTTHHHHDHYHDGETCAVCQLIEATITSLRNSILVPMSAWGIVMTAVPLSLIQYPLFIMIASHTLVRQNVRSNN